VRVVQVLELQPTQPLVLSLVVSTAFGYGLLPGIASKSHLGSLALIQLALGLSPVVRMGNCMFADKLKGLICIAAVVYFSSSASAQIWEPVDQSQQLANSWSEVVCEDGEGFQKCEKGEPVLECRAFQRYVNQFSHATSSRRGNCTTRGVYWDGTLIRGPYLAGRLASPSEYVVGGYKYSLHGAKTRDSGQCRGGDTGGVYWYGICRIEVE
tara:strand:- start:2326 stop:2958 length:633 start_codon:yes stop_codon:yes gene_type:complete